MTPTLEVQGLGIRFGGITAVADLSFDVSDGEVLGVIGPNGAGKSTLLNCISGVYRGFTGDVALRGNSLRGRRPHEIAALGVGRTLQSVEMFREISVRDFVRCGADGLNEVAGTGLLRRVTRRADRRARDERAEQVLTDLDLVRFADLSLGALPYGRRKMADVARALVAEPNVLLLDEPTAGTTAVEREEIAALLRVLGDRGVPVVVVDHDVSFIGSCTTSVVAMAGGRYLCRGTAAEVFAHPTVQDSYLGVATG